MRRDRDELRSLEFEAGGGRSLLGSVGVVERSTFLRNISPLPEVT